MAMKDWKKYRHGDWTTSVGAWRKIINPDGEYIFSKQYKVINIHPIWNSSNYKEQKNPKVAYYHIDEHLYGSTMQSYGWDTLGSFKTKSQALAYAKSYMRKN